MTAGAMLVDVFSRTSTDANIISVNDVATTSVDDFKADAFSTQVDVNVVGVNGEPVVIEDFRADVTKVDVNILEVNGISVSSVDDFKADVVEVDLSTIPAAVWAYATRELTTSLGLTPSQEAKLDQVLIDLEAVPTDTENAEAIARYTR